ncbi:SDR family NAD(P)-dependent oxidoreductase [Novosphingobium pentaromativorans]|nr:SDR family NAD(P)-dependent oxidoreductase [Novosphingobium pentaromativorans]AIT80573.1 hypothetical protein JI59_12735 [Novosphingobium pentaromativorans US6-1]
MTDLGNLQGQVIVITGAGAGIGEGIARAAAASGMKLVLADKAAERVDAVAASLREAGADATAFHTDVTDPAQVEELASQAYAQYGQVDMLINNAGIELIGLIWELPPEQWRRIMDINVLGVVNGLRAFVPRMLEAGKPAAIANLSSVGGVSQAPLQAAYLVSKHAVLSLTECLALELRILKAPIHVSAVLPGPVESRIFADSAAAGEHKLIKAHHEEMKAMIRDHGLPAQQAGERILAGIAAGDFWVSPHPEMMAGAAAARGSFLQGLKDPQLNERMAQAALD